MKKPSVLFLILIFLCSIISCFEQRKKNSIDVRIDSILATGQFEISDKLDTANGNNYLLKNTKENDYGYYLLKGQYVNSRSKTTGGVDLQVVKLCDGTFKCEGKFDEITLFGKFLLIGKNTSSSSDSLAKKLSFLGQLQYGGNDSSGYTTVYRISCYLSLVIYSNKAIGEFIMSETPSNYWGKQKEHGIANLSIIYKK